VQTFGDREGHIHAASMLLVYSPASCRHARPDGRAWPKKKARPHDRAALHCQIQLN
jgi:hypothetical protein